MPWKELLSYFQGGVIVIGKLNSIYILFRDPAVQFVTNVTLILKTLMCLMEKFGRKAIVRRALAIREALNAYNNDALRHCNATMGLFPIKSQVRKIKFCDCIHPIHELYSCEISYFIYCRLVVPH